MTARITEIIGATFTTPTFKTGNYTLTLPQKTGTLATTGDIPDTSEFATKDSEETLSNKTFSEPTFTQGDYTLKLPPLKKNTRIATDRGMNCLKAHKNSLKSAMNLMFHHMGTSGHTFKTRTGAKQNDTTITTFDNSNESADDDKDMTNTSSADSMFDGCSQLKTINSKHWRFGILNNASCMFRGCEALESLDTSKWNLSFLSNASEMFSGCSKVKKLDVSNWDTSSLETANNMFRGCIKLPTIDVASWDTSSLTTANRMFCDCREVEDLDLGNWDTSSLDNVMEIFLECKKLKNVDISNWKLPTNCQTNSMFGSCKLLEQVKANGATINRLVNDNVVSSGIDLSGLHDDTVYTFKGWYDSGKFRIPAEGETKPEEEEEEQGGGKK